MTGLMRQGTAVSLRSTPLFWMLLLVVMVERLTSAATEVSVERDCIPELSGEVLTAMPTIPRCSVLQFLLIEHLQIHVVGCPQHFAWVCCFLWMLACIRSGLEHTCVFLQQNSSIDLHG